MQFVNHTHRLGRGLVGMCLINERSGNKVFDLSGRNGNGTITGMTWQSGKFGSSLHGVNATDKIALPATYKPLDGGTGFTVIAYVKADSIDADSGIFYTDIHSSADPILLWFDNSTTDHFAACVNAGGRAGPDYSAFVPVAGVYYHVALVWSTSDDLVRLYINGVEDIGGNFPGAGAIGTLDATATSYTWANDSASSKQLIGNLDYGILYNRALSSSEIALLYREPFCMFKKDDIALMAAAAEAPPGGGQFIIIQMSAISLPFIVILCLYMVCFIKGGKCTK